MFFFFFYYQILLIKNVSRVAFFRWLEKNFIPTVKIPQKRGLSKKKRISKILLRRKQKKKTSKKRRFELSQLPDVYLKKRQKKRGGIFDSSPARFLISASTQARSVNLFFYSKTRCENIQE